MCFREEADEYIDIGALNGIFVLGRSMGFIGKLVVRVLFGFGLFVCSFYPMVQVHGLTGYKGNQLTGSISFPEQVIVIRVSTENMFKELSSTAYRIQEVSGLQKKSLPSGTYLFTKHMS